MLGGLSPALKGLSVDDTLLLTMAKTRLGLNLAKANTWTGAQQFNSTVGFGNQASFASNALFSSGAYFYSNVYFVYWSPGAIPFIGDSGLLSYNASDFFRDNTSLRYGFGIGSSLEAKVHVVAAGVCSGTPDACSTYTDSSACGDAYPCYWYSNGYCYSYSDEYNCSYQVGCSWVLGTACSTLGEYDCGNNSPCYWSASYANCSELTDEYSCNNAGGYGYCYWQSNSCSGYYDESSCNSSSGCSWSASYSDCSSIYDQTSCDNAGGGGYCSWDSGSGSCTGSQYPNGSGTCDGDNSYCSGSSYPSGGTCEGGYYGSYCGEDPICTGTPLDCNQNTTQTPCEASGCSWAIGSALKTDGKILTANMPTSDPADGKGTLWYNTSTNAIYRGT